MDNFLPETLKTTQKQPVTDFDLLLWVWKLKLLISMVLLLGSMSLFYHIYGVANDYSNLFDGARPVSFTIISTLLLYIIKKSGNSRGKSETIFRFYIRFSFNASLGFITAIFLFANVVIFTIFAFKDPFAITGNQICKRFMITNIKF